MLSLIFDIVLLMDKRFYLEPMASQKYQNNILQLSLIYRKSGMPGCTNCKNRRVCFYDKFAAEVQGFLAGRDY